MESSVDGKRSFEIKPIPDTYWWKLIQTVALTALSFGVGVMVFAGAPVIPALATGFGVGMVSGICLVPRPRQARLAVLPSVPNGALSLALSALGYHQDSAAPEAGTWRTPEDLGLAAIVTVHQAASETIIVGPARTISAVRASLAEEKAVSAPPLDEPDGANSDHVGESTKTAQPILALIPQVGFGKAASRKSGGTKSRRLAWMAVALLTLTGGAVAVAYNVFDTYAVRCSDPQVTQLVRTIIGEHMLPKPLWKGTDVERANAFALTNIGTARVDGLSRDCFGELRTNQSGLDVMISRLDDNVPSKNDKLLAGLSIAPLMVFRATREGMRLNYSVQHLDDGRLSVRILTKHISD